MSKAAADRLSALRFRRLLRLELDGIGELEKEAVGSLEGEDLIRVWIDVPIPRRVVIEVRRVDGSFARRALAIGSFPSDVAAEAVAVATSEMVRVQERVVQPTQPAPAPKPAALPRRPASFAVSGAASALVLPSSDPVFFIGPELGVDLRHGILGHRLYGRWQPAVGEPAARWLEIGAALDVRWPPPEQTSWRLHLGIKAGFVDLAIPNAVRIEGEETSHDWTVRLTGELGVEARIATGTWVMLSVEPGAALRPLEARLPNGGLSDIGGFALGFNLGLTADPFEEDDD